MKDNLNKNYELSFSWSSTGFVFQKFVVKSLGQVDFTIERGHFLLILYQLFFINPIDILIDML